MGAQVRGDWVSQPLATLPLTPWAAFNNVSTIILTNTDNGDFHRGPRPSPKTRVIGHGSEMGVSKLVVARLPEATPRGTAFPLKGIETQK